MTSLAFLRGCLIQIARTCVLVSLARIQDVRPANSHTGVIKYNLGMHRISVFVVAVSWVFVGCATKQSTPQPTRSPLTIVWSQNGWSDPDRELFYHLPEGSELNW